LCWKPFGKRCRRLHNRAVTIPCVAAALLAVLVAGPAWSAQDAPKSKYLDADNTAEALTMGAIEVDRVKETRRRCSEELPHLKVSFGRAELLWRDANKAEAQAVHSFRSGPDAGRVFEGAVAAAVLTYKGMLAALPQEKRQNLCLAFLVAAKEKKQWIGDKTPGVSAFLAQYLQRRPLSEAALEEYGFLAGCEKAASNRGADHDKAEPACRCNWSAVQKLSSAERTKLQELAKDPKALLEWPPGKGVLESLGECHRRHFG
jgi:hypothetical protein